ncbi:hypothetical protein IJ818_04735 [bacterium]|nr:hypothetical protein [bacterium]
MFKIGPKLHTQHCCCDEACSCHKPQPHTHQHCTCCCCHEEPKADKFEKTQVDKPSLKKALPLGAAAGLASAGLVMIASNIVAKAAQSKPITSAIAAGVGLGVATGVINGTLANAASKQAAQEQKQVIIA